MMTFLFLDSETGGLGLDKSLLTLCLEVLTQEDLMAGKKGDSLLLELKPDDEVYCLTAQGMKVNAIDLLEHDKQAISYTKGGELLYAFLYTHSLGARKILTPVGHGVDGDIRHIQDKLISKKSWDKFCTHRYLDTSSVCKYLQAIGKLEASLTGSLESLKHYLELEGRSHTADGDVKIIKGVLRHFLML